MFSLIGRELTDTEIRIFRFLFLRMPEARGNKKLIMEELQVSEIYMDINWEEIKKI